MATETVSRVDAENATCQVLLDLMEQRRVLKVLAGDLSSSPEDNDRAEWMLEDFDHDHPGIKQIVEEARKQW